MTETMTVEEMVRRSIKAMKAASKKVRRSPQSARAFLDAIGLDKNGNMGAPIKPKRQRKTARKTKK